MHAMNNATDVDIHTLNNMRAEYLRQLGPVAASLAEVKRHRANAVSQGAPVTVIVGYDNRIAELRRRQQELSDAVADLDRRGAARAHPLPATEIELMSQREMLRQELRTLSAAQEDLGKRLLAATDLDQGAKAELEQQLARNKARQQSASDEIASLDRRIWS